MSAPILLRGEYAIGAYLGIPPGLVRHKHRMGTIPTFKVRGSMCATTAALDDWKALADAGFLSSRA